MVVLRALGLGDFLTAVPALRALHRAYPGHRFRLAAPARHADLLALAGLPPHVLPTEGPRTPVWKGPPPELAVNLHGRGPQSTAALRALGPDRLWTYAHPDLPDVPGPCWVSGQHEVDVWCRLVGEYGVTADPADLRLAPPSERSRRPGAAVVHPGAAFPARRWPELRFAEVARWLTDRGYPVVVTGSREEHQLATRVARVAGLEPDAVIAGRTSLTRLAALVAEASVVVCGDTGVGHLATAYATPSVRLFGPVSPAQWGPRIDGLRHVCLWAQGRGDPWGTRPDPGLLRITTRDVLLALEELLARDVPVPSPRTGATARPRSAAASGGQRVP
ncbi:glycosyltransferase family 9 protein [Marinitenerispora sediminis]|uniref:Glycosyl transferase n=1 Tax=Marinitenerispora sediminis TaxID=1931232 RepID=A0A368T0S7_9ACTN|nr:glycosyltransferase family 9 protein [Marinitenerispora sediminis]RCV53211.1 glycosyl transferase [Marinitenerispora sediminis]